MSCAKLIYLQAFKRMEQICRDICTNLNYTDSANGHIITMIRLVDYDLLPSIAMLIIGFPLSVV